MSVSLIVAGAAVVGSTRVQTASDWTSTDVGAVGVPGSASFDNNVWTIKGDGSDIWGTADAFQFLHQSANPAGGVTVRVDDLQNTDPFAKVGLMVRNGTAADAATAVLDVRPTGDVEFMARETDGAAMTFVAGSAATPPAWLHLEWSASSARAWTSADGVNWDPVGSAGVNLPPTPEVGVAVTSHVSGSLTTAHVDSLSMSGQLTNGWKSADIGSVGLAGDAVEQNGGWTVRGAGADIWGTDDAFQFLYRERQGYGQHIVVRVDDLQNTSPFAKVGVMLRNDLTPDAATAILDVKPDGGVEFMVRDATGGAMQYLSGTTVTLPVWMELSWTRPVSNESSNADLFVRLSEDGVRWQPFGVQMVPFPLQATGYEAGLAVTSHDTAQLNTAHVHGLSLLGINTFTYDIGDTGTPGNAISESVSGDPTLLVEGAGSDVWGTADSFEFVNAARQTDNLVFTTRVVDLADTSPFAKSGIMVRDADPGPPLTFPPDAPEVILDVRPNGELEFMARECAGCETTFLATATLPFPMYLQLRRSGSTYEALAGTVPGALSSLGTVSVSMPNGYAGYAVTSHDPAHVTTAVFDDPPR